MSQAQAGLGNQEKAKRALDIATGLNPTLDFAPTSTVASLKEALTPQTAKIESIEPGHFWRNTFMTLFALGIFAGIYMMWRKKEDEAAREKALAELEAERALQEAIRNRERVEREAKEEAERQVLRAHKNYGSDQFDPKNPDVLLPAPKKKTKAELKAEADAIAAMDLREAQYQAKRAEQRARDAEALARGQAAYANHAPAPTIVNNNSGGNDMLTGVLIGNMLSSSHHDTTRVVERETIREVPTPSYTHSATQSVRESTSTSWDDTPSTPSKSSTWDDDSSSKSSSSWGSSSSDSSSSSWDSSSSSSDSSSSSSWD
jgi:hypothetical protein